MVLGCSGTYYTFAVQSYLFIFTYYWKINLHDRHKLKLNRTVKLMRQQRCLSFKVQASMFSHATTLVTWQETEQHGHNIVGLVPVNLGWVPYGNLEGVPYLSCHNILSFKILALAIQWELVASGLGVFLDGWAGGVPSICVLTELEVDTKSPGCLSHMFFPTRGVASFLTNCRPGWLSFPRILKITGMTSMHWPYQHFEFLSFLAQPNNM